MNTSQIVLAWLALVGLVGIVRGFYVEVGEGWVLVSDAGLGSGKQMGGIAACFPKS
jgi:hypothetical protein